MRTPPGCGSLFHFIPPLCCCAAVLRSAQFLILSGHSFVGRSSLVTRHSAVGVYPRLMDLYGFVKLRWTWLVLPPARPSVRPYVRPAGSSRCGGAIYQRPYSFCNISIPSRASQWNLPRQHCNVGLPTRDPGPETRYSTLHFPAVCKSPTFTRLSPRTTRNRFEGRLGRLKCSAIVGPFTVECSVIVSQSSIY